MQKVNFKYEILVHDDASTDGTDKIIKEFQIKFPDIVKPVFQTENQFRKGTAFVKNFLWKNIKGKYVALCEGDDYWTDESKLQKQVDYLDSHEECTVCFHPVKVIWEKHPEKKSYIFPPQKFRNGKSLLVFEELLKANFIQTNSVVYRWILKGREDLFPDNILPGDWYLHLLHAREGKIAMLDQVMAVYRRHSGGIWDGAGETESFYEQNGIPNLRFYTCARKEFGMKIDNSFCELSIRTFYALLKNHRFSKINELFSEFSFVSENIVNLIDEYNKLHEERKQQRRRIRKLIKLFFVSLVIVFVICYLLM